MALQAAKGIDIGFEDDSTAAPVKADPVLVQELIKRKGTHVSAEDLAYYKEDTERQKNMCAASDRVIAISRAMASLIVKHFDIDPRKVRQVYKG